MQCEEEHVRVHVDNHGPTLEAAELDLIFDPLFRGSAGASNKDAGHLGLGLFIVRQAAQAHGGTVEVHSANRQTRFSIVLPRDASPPRGNEDVAQERQVSKTSPRDEDQKA
ncbi:MAG: sensor histidine kinase [Burkholderiales bacterium]|nr:sensor histidine kinase [Burkholderiales bacterium]